MENKLIFKVVVQEGKGFGGEVHALCCSATFGDTALLTPFSVGKDKHIFNSTLTWSTSKQQVRKLSSAGQNVCKVVVQKKDGSKLGWVVLDLRKAKLNNQYSKEEGDWYPLSGGKVGEAAPQLRIFFSLAEDIKRDVSAEEAIMQQLDNRLNPGAGAATSPAASQPVAGPSPQAGAAASRQAQQLSKEPSYEADFGSDHEGAGASPGAPAPRSAAGLPVPSPPPASGSGPQATTQAPAPAPSVHSLRHPAAPAASQPQPAQPAPQISAAQATATASAAAAVAAITEGPFRSFGLTVDIRSFQAGRRLPLNMACTYIQAVLPSDVLELVVSSGHKLPSKMLPLKTHPAVDIPRGAEGAIPNGAGSLEFVAGVVQLARVLARDPRISVEVWHKERLRADTLLGVASVPLTPLLHDCWVDGYAPVYALLAAADGSAPAEKIQVGMLRVILSLEDKGPAQPPSTASPRSPRASPSRMVAASPLPMHERVPAAPAAHAPQHTQQQDAAPRAQAQAQSAEQQQQQPTARALDLQTDAAPVPPASQPQQVTLAAQPLTVPQVQQLPEYEAAYQLEAWKKAEELKWRAELSAREAQRMALLEGAWRKRERAREAEVAEMREQYLSLEARARQVLATAEERERKLVAAEEAVQRRRKDMEHEHASRMAEAEAAVRRLQIECEHQLEIERDRNAELARQRSALEERVAVAEARFAAIEQAFASYRDQVRNTNEAGLQRELLEARDIAARAEDRAARALRSKAAYKAQVQQLAEQLAVLYKRQTLVAGGGGGQADAGALRLASEEQARYTSSQQAELSALKQQLQALKVNALASLSPPHGNSPGARNDARMPQDQGTLAGAARLGAAVGDVRGTPTPVQSVTQLQSSQPVPAAVPPTTVNKASSAQPVAVSAAPAQLQPVAATPVQPVAGSTDTPTRSRSSHTSSAASAGSEGAPAATPAHSTASPTPPVAAAAPGAGGVLGDPLAVMRQLGLVGSDTAADAALLVGPGVAQPQLAEIKRLLKRKSELLATSVYEPSDPLIQAIEQRVAELAGLMPSRD